MDLTVDPTPVLGIADPLSAASHLLGALIFAVLGARLVRSAARVGRGPWSIGLYTVTVVLTLAISGLFHSTARGTEARTLLMQLDHAAIFLLIAGSYTPIHVIQFRGAMRSGVLAVVWTAALCGVTAKLWFFDSIPEWFGLTLYLALGWAGLFSATALYFRYGLRPLVPLFVGALAYTVGASMEFARIPTIVSGVVGPHEVFHLLVLVGVAAHWLYIARLPGKRRVVLPVSYPGSAS